MDFHLTDVQRVWAEKGASLGRELPVDTAAADAVSGAVRIGLLDPDVDLLAAALAVDALARESSSAAVALAVHTAALAALPRDGRFTAVARGEITAAVALAADQLPTVAGDRLTGRASWVGPLTSTSIALVAARDAGALTAWAIALDTPGASIEPVHTSGLVGLAFGHASFDNVASTPLGGPVPTMARVRVLLAAAGIGMGRRALREGLAALRAEGRPQGAGGEQTVQGLLADTATELEAATMLMMKAASAHAVTLADASMAKLAATEAAQRAVARATQVVGADAFTRGHVLERLTQDVRALEIFAGRTEALREAVAEATLS
jgi:alkylation response protein AidB-like acyl-CoA dehydrogenase